MCATLDVAITLELVFLTPVMCPQGKRDSSQGWFKNIKWSFPMSRSTKNTLQ